MAHMISLKSQGMRINRVNYFYPFFYPFKNPEYTQIYKIMKYIPMNFLIYTFFFHLFIVIFICAIFKHLNFYKCQKITKVDTTTKISCSLLMTNKGIMKNIKKLRDFNLKKINK